MERSAQAIEMTTPGYCAWGCFSAFCFEARQTNGRPQGGAEIADRLDLIERTYSHDQVEKSFSYCGTSFQTPFSFLAVMVISCG